jgi:predicted DNA-binding protein
MRVIAMTIVTTTIKKPASVRLSARLNSALNQQAKQLKISKDALVRQAIVNLLEDMKDLQEIENRRGEKSYSLAEVKAELGL